MKITSQPSNGIDLNVTFDGRTFTLPRLIEHVRNLESAQDQIVGEQSARDRHPAGKGCQVIVDQAAWGRMSPAEAAVAFSAAINDSIAEAKANMAAADTEKREAVGEKLAATIRLANARCRKAHRDLAVAQATVRASEDAFAYAENQLVDARQKLDAFIEGAKA